MSTIRLGLLSRQPSSPFSTACRKLTITRFRPALRRYASIDNSGPAVTATNREAYERIPNCNSMLKRCQQFAGAETTLKRFWKKVDLDQRGESFAITLDKRPLKTPSGKTLLIPQKKTLLAALIASEWENQETLLKPHALPLVRNSFYRP